MIFSNGGSRTNGQFFSFFSLRATLSQHGAFFDLRRSFAAFVNGQQKPTALSFSRPPCSMLTTTFLPLFGPDAKGPSLLWAAFFAASILFKPNSTEFILYRDMI